MADGEMPVPDDIKRLLAKHLDVPQSAWRTRRRKGLVSGAVTAHTGRVTGNDTAASVTANGVGKPRKPRRRLHNTAVHVVLDRIGWTIGDLAKRVSAELTRQGRAPVSRASMQFYATGSRKVIKSKKRGPEDHAVQAPIEVRKAAYAVTVANASEHRLGPDSILHPNSWPNVEAQQ